MIVTSLSRDFGTLLLSHSLANSLGSVFSLSNWYLLTILPGDLVADFSGDLSLNLVLDSLAFFLRVVLCHLLVLSLAFLSVFSVANFLGHLGALLSKKDYDKLLSKNFISQTDPFP